MFIFEIEGIWNLSETKSGLNISKVETKEETIKKSDEPIKEKTEKTVKNLVEERTK